jgi:curved DNA-binding protein CbpA
MSNNQSLQTDAYRLFLLNPSDTFTRSQIRARMRVLVLSTHPDRPGGSNQKFNIVNKCYKYLLGVIAERERTERPVNEATIREFGENRDIPKIPNANANRFNSSKKFDNTGFNAFYEENRLDDTLQSGHGDWLQTQDDDYETKHHTKLQKGQFQEAFEEERRKLLAKRQIVKHTGIMPMSIRKSTLAAADVDEIGMMSNTSAGTVKCSNGVMGVDIREALEIGVLGTADTPEEYGTVTMEEAQRRRKNGRITLTEKEKQEYENYKKQKEKEERERQRRIKERESQIMTHFERINQMITN